MIERLERDPKQFPKKHGILANCRAAPVRFADGVEWRVVYSLDEERRSVRILALGPHDDAYDDAARRV